MSVLIASIFQRGAYGSPPSSVYPLSNINDGNSGTVADFPGSAAAGYAYCIIDMLSPIYLDRVVLQNASLAGGQAGVAFSIGVDISNVLSTTGIPGDTPGGRVYPLLSQTVQANPPTNETITFVPQPGSIVQGRYAYVSYTSNAVSPPAPPSMTIGEASAYALIPVPVLIAVGELINNQSRIAVASS